MGAALTLRWGLAERVADLCRLLAAEVDDLYRVPDDVVRAHLLEPERLDADRALPDLGVPDEEPGRERLSVDLDPAGGVDEEGDRGERDRASAYYRQELLGPIAARCRAQLPTDWPDRPRLVTFLSGTSELVELVVRIHRPSRVLILCTSETEVQQDRAAEQVAEAAGAECVVEFRKISSDTLPGTLPSAVMEFARGGRAEDLVLDLTPGTKAITLALYTDLAISESRHVYVCLHLPPDGSTIQFGTEELVFLPTPARNS